MLDAQAGVQYVGESLPVATADDRIAITAWNLLSDGMTIDFAGFDLVCAYLGVTDVEVLLDRLRVIKAHDPAQAGKNWKD